MPSAHTRTHTRAQSRRSRHQGDTFVNAVPVCACVRLLSVRRPPDALDNAICMRNAHTLIGTRSRRINAYATRRGLWTGDMRHRSRSFREPSDPEIMRDEHARARIQTRIYVSCVYACSMN